MHNWRVSAFKENSLCVGNSSFLSFLLLQLRDAEAEFERAQFELHQIKSQQVLSAAFSLFIL